MAIGHIAPGAVMPYTNGGGTPVTSGTVVPFAAMVGVALGDIAPAAAGTLAVSGIWVLPKDGALAIAQGDQLYWDAVNDEVDKTDTNVPCGKAAMCETANAATVRVILNR